MEGGMPDSRSGKLRVGGGSAGADVVLALLLPLWRGEKWRYILGREAKQDASANSAARRR